MNRLQPHPCPLSAGNQASPSRLKEGGKADQIAVLIASTGSRRDAE
jgi:hypothetical protein